MFAILKSLLISAGLDKAYNYAVKLFLTATEGGYVPDFLLRRAIRFLLAARIAQVRFLPAVRLGRGLKLSSPVAGKGMTALAAAAVSATGLQNHGFDALYRCPRTLRSACKRLCVSWMS